MRTQDSSFGDYGYEKGSGTTTKHPASVDRDLEALQNGQNNLFESLNERVRNNPILALKERVRLLVSGVMRSRGSVGAIWKFTLLFAVYILFVPIYNAVLEVPCKLPVLPQHFPHCTRELPDFTALAQLQSRLEYVMESSASSSKVAVDIKDSEMALRDLRTQVAHSALSNKDILGQNLKLFVEDAKAAGGNLQQFGSRVWGAVDRVVSLNQHMLIMLESPPTSEVAAERPNRWWKWGAGGEVGLGVPDRHYTGQGSTISQKQAEIIWEQAIELLEKTLRRLIHEAQANIGSLQRLEERLDNIADMVAAEEQGITDKEKQLRKQWFRELLKLNKGERDSHRASLGLLETVKDNRKRALNHVTGVLLKLRQMSNDLDDLREGVVTPIIIPGLPHIPIKAHMRSIRSATDRLIYGQTHMRQIEDEYRRGKFTG